MSLLPQRTPNGGARWLCECECGNKKEVSLTNLTCGNTISCGCYSREQSSVRIRQRKKPARVCKISSCKNTTEKGSVGYCGKHYARVKRYGDPEYITPDNIRITRLREALIKSKPAKPETYKKFFGRHYHRAVAEKSIGRKLVPGEIVHHIDGDKHNNAPENLQVMTQSEHVKLHFSKRINS